MRICSLVVVLYCLIGKAWSCDDLSFAETLKANGYEELAISYYKEVLKSKQISEKQKDHVYITLYQLLRSESALKQGDEADRLRSLAESYFSKIRNSDAEEVLLEKVKSDLRALKGLAKTEDSMDKKRVSTLFEKIAKVTEKIRSESRRWIDDFESMDDRDRRKVKNEYDRQARLEIDASLKFGEACIAYEKALGADDPKVRGWLEKMAKSYESFIANNYGSIIANYGSVYYGQVCILLKTYKDDYGDDVDGIEAGTAAFENVYAWVQEASSSNSKAQRDLAVNLAYAAYQKNLEVLERVELDEQAIDLLIQLFDWKPVSEFHKQAASRQQFLLGHLEKLCKKLKASFESGKKERATSLYRYTLKGYNFTKKQKSPWSANFTKLLSELPKGVDIEENADIAFNRARELERSAGTLTGEKKQDALIAAAAKYKKVMDLLRHESEVEVNDKLPLTGYYLGRCQIALGNPLLALATFLRIVELYPSQRFSEKAFPELFRKVSACARAAKGAALSYYKRSQKSPFSLTRYEATLELISKRFPEEGGGVNYELGLLKKSAKDYGSAKQHFLKVEKTDKMFYKATMNLLEIEHLVLMNKANLPEKPKLELATKIKSWKDKVLEGMDMPTGMSEKDFEYLRRSEKEVVGKALKIMAALYTSAGADQEAYDVQKEIFKNSTRQLERFAALQSMVKISYKSSDLESLSQDLQLIDSMQTESDMSLGQLNSLKSSSMQMKANLLTKIKLNPLKAEVEKDSGDKSKGRRLSQLYAEVADLFYDSLVLSGEKREDILKKVISYYGVAKTSSDKTLKAIDLFFQWNPDEPELSLWHKQLLGRTAKQWDDKLGGIMTSISQTYIKKSYKEFLDYLFDSKDYGSMTLMQVRKQVALSKDKPRSYSLALEVFDDLVHKAQKDLKFRQSGLPELMQLRPKMVAAREYFALKLQRAQCLASLGDLKKAADAYQDLSKYFVEYPQIKTELMKLKMSMGGQSSYEEAESLLRDLLMVVPGPSSQSYDPMMFFELQLWFTKVKIALGDGKKAIVENWKYLRSMVVQDLGYFEKSARRFASLKISGEARVMNEAFIDRFKSWVKDDIFSLLSKSDSDLQNDNWETLLGVGQ